MIKVNVAEIKKQLTGEKAFRMEVDPDDLELSEADLPVVGKIHLEGKYDGASSFRGTEDIQPGSEPSASSWHDEHHDGL